MRFWIFSLPPRSVTWWCTRTPWPAWMQQSSLSSSSSKVKLRIFGWFWHSSPRLQAWYTMRMFSASPSQVICWKNCFANTIILKVHCYNINHQTSVHEVPSVTALCSEYCSLSIWIHQNSGLESPFQSSLPSCSFALLIALAPTCSSHNFSFSARSQSCQTTILLGCSSCNTWPVCRSKPRHTLPPTGTAPSKTSCTTCALSSMNPRLPSLCRRTMIP